MVQVYSGAASEAAFIGKESPGPQAYDQHRSGLGRQVGVSTLQEMLMNTLLDLSILMSSGVKQQPTAYASST